jgi:hypothetical protein
MIRALRLPSCASMMAPPRLPLSLLLCSTYLEKPSASCAPVTPPK